MSLECRGYYYKMVDDQLPRYLQFIAGYYILFRTLKLLIESSVEDKIIGKVKLRVICG